MHLLALACAATLLPLAAPAQAAAPPADGRPIVLAQLTQKQSPKRDGYACKSNCPKGRTCWCDYYYAEGIYKCGCRPMTISK
jgi:hypothetical protein